MNYNSDWTDFYRFMTVLFFLDDTDHGGETAFPVVGVDPYENELADDSGVS